MGSIGSIGGVPATRRNLVNLVGMTGAIAWPPNAAIVARNAVSRRRRVPWRDYVAQRGLAHASMADRALGWICHSQDRVGTGGVGDFRFHGWTPGYPEVTGSIIPTLWDHHHLLSRDDLAQRAIRMASWELAIQQPGGGFESLYEGEGRPPVVFNTAQVLRGLVRSFQETRDSRYLDAAIRAGDWIVASQESDGSWTKANYLGMKRTYDTFAAAGLAQLGAATSNEAYGEAAIANCEFAIRNQLENGWFELCDNTAAGNEAPITHTLCYTADGLIETGEILGESRLVGAGELTARAMLERIEPGGLLPGRFGRDWSPRASYVVLTGSAQLGIILMKMHARTGDPRLRKSAEQLLDFLAYVQDLNALGRNRSGAIAGSWPIWGRYVPLKYPSWATKFFLDHLRSLRVADRPEGPA